jgi:type II secretory pathway component PulF
MKRRIPLGSLAELFHNLSYLDLAGISLEEAIITLAQTPPHPLLKIPLQHILQEMQSGLLFSQTLAQHPTIFSKLIIQVIAVGEKTGKLAPYFQEVDNHLRWQIHLSQTISQTLRYGGMLFSLIIAMILAVTTFLLPQIEGLLLSLGVAELPWTTRALLLFGRCFESVGVLLILALPILTLVFLRYQPAFLRHLPGLGPLLIAQNVTYFLKTLAALLQARVDLLLALQQAQQTVTFPYLRKALAQVPTTIAAGATLSEALAAQPYFPPMALRLIRLGESTGRLPALVTQAATGCQQQYAQRVEHLVTLLHPALVMILGLLILWIVLATLLPLYHHLDGGLGG